MIQQILQVGSIVVGAQAEKVAQYLIQLCIAVPSTSWILLGEKKFFSKLALTVGDS